MTKGSPLSAATLSWLSKNADLINQVAARHNIAPELIAGPIARELNRTNVGEDIKLNSVLHPILLFIQDRFLSVQSNVAGPPHPVSHITLLTEFEYLQANPPPDKTDSKFNAFWVPGNFRLMNDLGPAKIQGFLGLQILENYLSENPDTDPLGWRAKYEGKYDEFVKDLRRDDTLALDVQARIAKLAEAFFTRYMGNDENGIDRYGSLSIEEKTYLVTTYSAQGEAKLLSKVPKHSEYFPDGAISHGGDLPPLKWSSLRYDFRMEDKIDGKEEAYG